MMRYTRSSPKSVYAVSSRHSWTTKCECNVVSSTRSCHSSIIRALPDGQDDSTQNAQPQDRLQQQPEQQAHQHTHPDQPPLIWCQGLAEGTFGKEVASVFPPVKWQPSSLLKVLSYGLPAAATAVLINNKLQSLLTNSSRVVSSTATNNAIISAVADADAAQQQLSVLDSAVLQQALLHLSQEFVFAALMPAAVWLALGNRVVSCRWSSYWAVQTLATCAVLFPFVDPILSSLWQPAVEAVLGPAPVNQLVATLHEAADSSQWSAVGLHCLASGVLGPIWEEVFWRGFFLTALTKVLPLPACVALSSLNFAVLHLSPHNFLPLLVLSVCCDGLYLRSGGNLLAPLLLHGLWNGSQVLQIALLHKDTFV